MLRRDVYVLKLNFCIFASGPSHTSDRSQIAQQPALQHALDRKKLYVELRFETRCLQNFLELLFNLFGRVTIRVTNHACHIDVPRRVPVELLQPVEEHIFQSMFPAALPNLKFAYVFADSWYQPAISCAIECPFDDDPRVHSSSPSTPEYIRSPSPRSLSSTNFLRCSLSAGR